MIMHCSAWWQPGAAPAASRTSCWRWPAPKAGHDGGSPAGAAECLVRGVARDVLPQTIEREIDFAFEPAPAELAVMGDATLLGELARNLVDNAFKLHAAGWFRWCWRSSVNRRALWSMTPVPGVAEADRERVSLRHSRAWRNSTPSPVPRYRGRVSDSPLFARWHRHGATVGIETSSMNGAICCQFRVSRRQSAVSPAL